MSHFKFQKKIVSAETIHGNTVCANLLTSKLPADFVILCTVCWDELWHLLKVMTSSSANYRLVYRFFFHRIFLRLTSLSELWTRFFFFLCVWCNFFSLAKQNKTNQNQNFDSKRTCLTGLWFFLLTLFEIDIIVWTLDKIGAIFFINYPCMYVLINGHFFLIFSKRKSRYQIPWLERLFSLCIWPHKMA